MRYNKNGIALVSVMCFMMVLAILGTVFSMAVGTHVRTTSHEMNLEKAVLVAEAGAERGAAYVASGGSIPHSFSGTFGGGVFRVTITAISNAESDGSEVAGSIDINPNNSPDCRFTLMLADGQVIDRNSLQQSYDGYSGIAASVRVEPKGSGNQNSLTVDGNPYPISNDSAYLIESDDMTVNLYNDNVKRGKALGKWYISITATGATVTEC